MHQRLGIAACGGESGDVELFVGQLAAFLLRSGGGKRWAEVVVGRGI
jgi:hypothetical protein